jgi:two-component system, chemotaxis family, sensor kinase CheA
VLALEEARGTADSLAGLKRSLHNLKGICRLLLSEVRRLPPVHHPLRAMSELCHTAESFVESFANETGAPFCNDGSDALLETVDWLKALLRAFESARDDWPSELLEKLGRLTAEVVPASIDTASAKQVQRKIAAATEQCGQVLRAVEDHQQPDKEISSGEWKMLSRALDTLERAAHFEGVAGLAAQARTLVTICESASVGTSTDLAESEQTWSDFRERYRSMLEACEERAISVRPCIHHSGRTISLRASGGPTEAALARQPETTCAQRSIRVDQAKLDRMMRAVGELLVAKNALPVLAERVRTEANGVAGKEIRETGNRIAHIADDLQDAMRQIRMMPIRTVFQRFPRMIRDLARSECKQVQLIISGDETELDKTVLEQIADPLVHLIRNAIDHGIELPGKRLALGKAEMGTVGLEVLKEGSNVIVRVSDDGRSMDPQQLRTKAVEKGILSAADAAMLSDKCALELIYRPGFSTAEKVTDVSGRGVGMDVVQSNIRQLRGAISLSSEMGRGSVVAIKLPSSLMVSKGILVQCATERYVLPIEGIREMVKVRRAQICQYRDMAMANIRGQVYPVFNLSALLGLKATSDETGDPSPAEEVNTAIVSTHRGSIAVVVDRLVAEIDVIAKPLSEGLEKLLVFQGAAILGDGSVALIIDATQLDSLIDQVSPQDRPNATLVAEE